MPSLVSINSHGLRSQDRRATTFSSLRRNRYDIILLQETHWTDEIQDDILREWNGDIYFSNGTNSARGVAILLNPRLDYNLTQTKHDTTGRVINITIELEDQTLCITNIYAPRTDTERKQFYLNLDPYLATKNYNIIGGDFNCITNTRLDKLGGNPDARQTANTELYTIAAKHDLTDIWRDRNPDTRGFTWTGRHPTDNTIIRTRIDKFMVNKAMTHVITNTEIKPYAHSDHDSITMTLDFGQQKRGPGYWHFNNSLLTDALLDAEIQHFWTYWLTRKNDYDNPLIWWDKAKQHFKRISIKHSTARRKTQRNERSQLERNLITLQQKAA
ncbi:predicted protein, partial [Nematostella vectensis]